MKVLVTGGAGGHGLRSPGSVVQTLQTVKTDTTSVSSVNSFEDISGMSVAITPTSTTSKVLVTLDMRLGTNSNRNITYRLMRGSTAIYVGDTASNRTQCTGGMRMLSDEKYEMRSETAVFLDSPSTTSQIVYTMYWNPNGGGAHTMYLGEMKGGANNTCPTFFTATEILA